MIFLDNEIIATTAGKKLYFALVKKIHELKKIQVLILQSFLIQGKKVKVIPWFVCLYEEIIHEF